MTVNQLVRAVQERWPDRWVAIKTDTPSVLDDSDTCSAPTLAMLAGHLIGGGEDASVVLIVAPRRAGQNVGHHLAV